MRKIKTGIVVDNPARDLTMALLLAEELLKRDQKVYLIPMYFLGIEVPRLGLDNLVVNYIRTNNIKKLSKFRALGTRILVLDTEGGSFGDSTQANSAENFAKIYNDIKGPEETDFYFFWGKKIESIFREYSDISEDKILTTGCPRFDLYHYMKSFRKDDVKNILINTNFTLSNSFNNSMEQEVDALVDYGYVRNEAREIVESEKILFDAFMTDIKEIVKLYPKEQFVLRPHPFEKISTYEKIFENDSNIIVRRDGEVHEEILRSKFLLHTNCSTAVEATFLGCIPISFKYLMNEKDYLAQPLAVDCSYSMKSIKELNDILNTELVLENSDNLSVIENYYDKIDGKSSMRVADRIDAFKPVEKIRNSFFLRITNSADNLIGKLFGVVTFITPVKVSNLIYRAIKSRIYTKSLCNDVLSLTINKIGKYKNSIKLMKITHDKVSVLVK